MRIDRTASIPYNEGYVLGWIVLVALALSLAVFLMITAVLASDGVPVLAAGIFSGTAIFSTWGILLALISRGEKDRVYRWLREPR